jgi:hypothetical protein
MSFARVAAIAVAASMVWYGSATAAGPLRAFRLGFWSGGAYTDDRTGGFTHCSAGVAYDSGINMFVLVTGGYGWWLGFANPQWGLTPNARLPVELRLDKRVSFARDAIVPNGQLLLVPLPDNSRLIDEFRRSSQLNLIAERISFFFKLSDTSAVMDKLAGCVRISVALETHASPPPPSSASAASAKEPTTGDGALSAASVAAANGSTAGSGAPGMPGSPPAASATASPAPERHAATETSPTAGAGTAPTAAAAPAGVAVVPERHAPPAAAQSLTASAAPEAPASLAAAAAPGFAPLPEAVQPPQPATPTEIEEVRLARDFFTTAQLPNARLAFTDKPAALAGFAAVWRSDAAAGTVKIIPPGSDVSGIGIASNLIAVDPRMCKGNFASSRSSAAVDSSVVVSAVLSCTEANEQRTAQYYIAPRRRGGFVVFAVIGRSGPGGAALCDQQRIDLFTRAALRAADNGG